MVTELDVWVVSYFFQLLTYFLYCFYFCCCCRNFEATRNYAIIDTYIDSVSSINFILNIQNSIFLKVF